MLPLNNRENTFFPEYFRRIVRYDQMDFECAFTQMMFLCQNPEKVYQLTSRRKQTKNQWARDDPAFPVVQIFLLVFASIAYSITFHRISFVDILFSVCNSVFVDFVAMGIIISSICWWYANRHLKIQLTHSFDQQVEWMYAFDIHCNSFFPLFLILYPIQFCLLPILLMDNFLCILLGNSLYLLSCCVYWYITHLGFRHLPFIASSERFLYPLALMCLVILIATLFKVNICVFAMSWYFS